MLKRLKFAYQLAKMMEQKSITPGMDIPSYQDRQPIWNDWTTENAVQHGYKASTWVYSCVSRISKTASSVPWKVYQHTGDGSWEEVPEHPLQQLIEYPNPFMSGQDLIERMTTHLYLGGNAILSKIRANNIVAELFPISPDTIKPVVSKTDFISHYEFNANGQKQQVDAQDVIHFMFVDPSNMYWGLAPLQAVARSVDTDNEMLNWQKVSLQNRAIADGVFSFREPLTIEQWEDARRMIREQHQGSQNARTPWVLGGDAQWTQMSLNAIELDMLNSRRMTREEIASVFNVPPPMIGLYENATLSNIETARKIFWMDTMIPLLNDLKSAFNRALAPEFGNDIRLDYDISNVESMQENYAEKVNTARALWGMGFPINQINQRLELGFDDLPWGDDGLLPMNLMPVANSVPNQVETNEPSETASYQFVQQKERVQNRTRTCGCLHELPINENIDISSIPRVKSWNLQSEEQKTVYWKNFDRRRQGWAGQFSRRIRTVFNNEIDEVMQAFERSGTQGAINVVDNNQDEWFDNFRALYTAIIEDFGNQTWEGLKSEGPSEWKQEEGNGFNPFDEWIQRWVRNMAGEKIRNITNTTKLYIRDTIARGMDEGLGVDSIARNLRSGLENMARIRSETIARTETASASNFGGYASARQTGLNPLKVWVSSRDDRVRTSHQVVDGQQVGMDDYFDVLGDLMLFPGDVSGDAENVVNCRCTLSYTTRRVVNDELVPR